MRSSRGRKSVNVIFGLCKAYNGSTGFNGFTLSDNKKPFDECNAGKRLQHHLEDPTKIFLKEECISTKCYVKIARLSNNDIKRATNTHQPSLRQHSCGKKTRNFEKEVNKKHSNILNLKHQTQLEVSSLTITIPSIMRKTLKHRTTSDNDSKKCTTVSNTKSSLHIDCSSRNPEETKNIKLPAEVRKSVIIPLKLAKHSVGSTQQIQGDKYDQQQINESESNSDIEIKSSNINNDIEMIHIDAEMEIGNSQEQINRVSGKLENGPDSDYTEGSSEVSFDTPSLKNNLFTPTNVINNNKTEDVKRCRTKWNNSLIQEKRRKSILRSWK